MNARRPGDRKARVRKPSITSLHPGSAEVAKVMGWSVEIARLVADLPGCPLVRGGKGKRFTSTSAFKAWFEALPIDSKRKVPAIDTSERIKLGAEIARLTWYPIGLERDTEAERLARAHEYEELVKMRDEWKARDAADRVRS